MKPFATAFVLIVAGILIIGATDAPPKQVNASPAPPDNSAELAALRAENADLRQQLSSPVAPVVDTVAAPIPAVDSFSPLQQEMLAHSNAIRLVANKPPQALDDRLCRAAQEQADYLARTGQFDHYVNGNPRRRAAKHGFPVRDENDIAAVQENLAGGFSSAANVFNGWSKTGHLAAILADRPLCGFGVAKDRSRWVALYGKETAGDQHSVGLFGNCAGGACAVTSGPVAVRRQPQYAQAPKRNQYASRRGGGGWRPGKFVAKVIGK